MSYDLNALAVFATVAEERSFRGAADRLGVTRSAISQSIRRLEEALGTALFRRTTRSVGLTEAGEKLRAEAAPAIAELRSAMDNVRDLGGTPRGQLRLAVSSIAESFLSGPLLTSFTRAFPEVQLDILVTDEEGDIIGMGFDAGVRLGEVIEQDMIAVPVSDDQHQLAVCSPSYLAERGEPGHPRDLARHRCIGWRPAPHHPPYRWEFTEGGRDFAVDVAPEVTTNDMGLMIRMAVSGAGITFGMADTFRAFLERGELVPLLQGFSLPFPGFYLYYPSRRNMDAKLRALIDHIKSQRSRKEAGRDRPTKAS
ncbi:LysR family transcriptional regulator [Pseudoroseomonas ludipueritiae]|uniref:LysR family transcriptional regulator n=1 Tax=Pseudoroseomonas ludipueritiae TaxID=198093 RepID=A0ABR7RB22_9PROT|nr:LysR family transcriptional regulator [Pseudoroseomonas ludipueritiae]MBC9178889.1 LysR family transcriptional regulator [Pseudoroseomonas ludipueritiae]